MSKQKPTLNERRDALAEKRYPYKTKEIITHCSISVQNDIHYDERMAFKAGFDAAIAEMQAEIVDLKQSLEATRVDRRLLDNCNIKLEEENQKLREENDELKSRNKTMRDIMSAIEEVQKNEKPSDDYNKGYEQGAIDTVFQNAHLLLPNSEREEHGKIK